MAVERPKVKFSEHGELIVTTAVLCQILDLGPEMISRHNRAGMPKVATGWWNIREVLVWLGMSKDKDGTKSAAQRKLEAEADYKEARAKREKRLSEVLDGQYIDVADVQREWTGRVLELKSSLGLLAKAVSKEFPDTDTRVIVERTVNECVNTYLESYSREGKYTKTEIDHKKKK